MAKWKRWGLQNLDAGVRFPPAPPKVVVMDSKQILQKYLAFFEKRGHKQVPNVSLVPENDPTLLYVNSGMFPLVPYLSGEPHPLGKRIMNVQRCLRFFEDLENVGETNRHTTAFHMLGNWGLGDYFKEEQLEWVFEFLVRDLGLDINKMYASVFSGDEDAPKDDVSVGILKKVFAKYGVEAKEGERIFAYGKEENWWQRGEAVGELGGPDSEVFYYIGGDGDGFGKDPAEHQDEFLEIGNSVFMQYRKIEGGWEELSQKNVDFGGGLERIAAAVQGFKDIYLTDNFYPIIEKIEEISGEVYKSGGIKVQKPMRIITDHMRAATFLAMDGVVPSNKDQGYILRRLIRRVVRAGRSLGVEKNISVNTVPVTGSMFSWLYPELGERVDGIQEIFAAEEEGFRGTLSKAEPKVIKKVEKLVEVVASTENEPMMNLAAKAAFDAYQSWGVPVEFFKDKLIESNVIRDEAQSNYFDLAYKNMISDHQKKSRAGAEQKFKGGLADHSEQVLKYHTATHLLHLGLREVLGDQIVQHGSNITVERLRFDFNHQQKMTKEQLKQVEEVVNKGIKEALPVKFEILSKEKALETGAIHAFNEKYGDKVKIYYIGESLDKAVSKEFCGGPHVKNTSEIPVMEIYKQDKIGEGMLRVYAKAGS